jgi:lipopolysaccharide/colanic/teichoic acid biosynthesis glycosyltransferase
VIGIFRFLIPARVLTLFISEALLIFGCYAAASYYASDLPGSVFLFETDWLLLLIPVGVILLGFYFTDLYVELRVRSLTVLLQQLSVAIGFALVAEALVGYLDLDWVLPARIVIAGSLLSVAVVLLWRRLFSAAIQNGVASRRLLFLGFSPSVGQLSEHLRQHPELGMTPVGYLDDGNPGPVLATDLPLVGSRNSLQRGIDEYKPSWIVVAKRRQVGPEWVDEFLRLRFGGIDAADVAGLYETIRARLCLAEMQPGDLLFGDNPGPNQFNVNLQSMYSTLLALLSTPIVLPSLAILALLVKAASPGPVFVREERIGRNGIPFTIRRLRTTNAGGDARMSRFGRWLERSGFSGLPLIWNILRGEMTFVGPEPDRPEFSDRLNQAVPFNFQRTAVKPGVTGWAQVHDLGDDPMHDALRRLEYDLYYIKNLSPSIDVFVLLRSLRDLLSFGI